MKTPASLKWLINRKARLLGEINQLEATIPAASIKLESVISSVEARITRLKDRLSRFQEQQAQFEKSLRHLEALKSDLNAIDATLAQHDIQITPGLIKPIRPQWADRLLSYGEMTRQIYACLKAAYPEARTTDQVTIFVVNEARMELNASELKDFRRRIKQRLGHLTWEKKLARLHEPTTREEGRWTLLLTPHTRAQIKALLGD